MEYWKFLEKLISENQLVIDRKKGSSHPLFPSAIYPVDYGYISNTRSMDGSCIDVFVGENSDMQVKGIMCTIDMLKNDSEIKVMLGCSSQEIDTVLVFLNNSAFMKAIFIDRFNS